MRHQAWRVVPSHTLVCETFFSLLPHSACLSPTALPPILGTRGLADPHTWGCRAGGGGCVAARGCGLCRGHSQLLVPAGQHVAAVCGCTFSFGNAGIRNKWEQEIPSSMPRLGCLPRECCHFVLYACRSEFLFACPQVTWLRAHLHSHGAAQRHVGRRRSPRSQVRDSPPRLIPPRAVPGDPQPHRAGGHPAPAVRQKALQSTLWPWGATRCLGSVRHILRCWEQHSGIAQGLLWDG